MPLGAFAKKMINILALSWVLFSITVSCVSAATETYFTAAVFEFTQFQECYYTQEEADKVVKTNLDIMVKVAELAKSKDVDILVLPEYGVFPECFSGKDDRKKTRFFLEDIPDPETQCVNPCDNPEVFANRPQLYTLSCIAKNNSMFLQANSGDIKFCEGEIDCPPDGHHHFNTNIVFDRKGTLVIRYHKEHLWGEVGMDISVRKQNPTFITDFGTFATYVCFDLVLARIIEVVEGPGVDGVVFSTMWENTVPFFTSVHFFQSWVIGNNLTLLAADIQYPGELAVGSGIFHGREGALAYTFDPDGISKLVVARVPKKGHALTEPKSSITAMSENGTFYEWQEDGKNVPHRGSMTQLGDADDKRVTFRYREIDMTNYTLVKLVNSTGYLEACHNNLCCSVFYCSEEISEDYYLAVFNGTQSSFGPLDWCEEDCAIVRCDPVDGKPCATFPLWSNDRFHHIHLRSNFSTPFMYPSVVSNHSRLLPLDDWDYHLRLLPNGYEANMFLKDEVGKGIISFGLIGRCYERDSAYSFF